MHCNSNTIEKQLKIIHACEKGATGVYYGHRIIAKIFFPNMVPSLDEMHQHECEHFSIFVQYLKDKNISKGLPPTLWCGAGIIYGLFVGALGENSIWVSTARIEEIVNKELDDAASFLREKEPEIFKAVLEIQKDELLHQNIAADKADFSGLKSKIVSKLATQCSYAAKFVAACT
ncbi:2-octaprenyl-3-methyl-6-methoxy-1,4-benzoquinol hydroxylase [Pseudomonas sp. 8BK]|uniref:demethoxyubiquinone hydroxylase family protein n=1 Tax=Pseudomonas sp. 8BK TaxID=2653164 RepID=UPI0012F3678B|nr:demethoxyubiquinone hydroxylase family protein [Pseudomonas sp. 8BK]VXB53605.1 2-octaprenyl-3-methyl-6-methoxy-1,4-benzoquinol hydroxylase [Pseudomonas sp. 8BK]